jgi:competence protein ComEC
MRKPRKKVIVLILGLSFLLFLGFSFFISKKDGVFFLNVGQGDAIFIRNRSGYNILIDGGPDYKVLSELGRVLPWWDRQIDLLILTHNHDDHVGGLFYVLEKYRVKYFMYNGRSVDSFLYNRFVSELEKKEVPTMVIKKSFVLPISSDLALDFIYPDRDISSLYIKNENNASITLKVSFKNKTFLLPGDLEEETEEYLLSQNIDLQSDILKLGHHGSDSSSSLEFLRAVNPQNVVIQVGKDNRFGHPSPRILKRLEQLEISHIYRTDQDGLIIF